MVKCVKSVFVFLSLLYFVIIFDGMDTSGEDGVDGKHGKIDFIVLYIIRIDVFFSPIKCRSIGK
jgi:hypothetical protein